MFNSQFIGNRLQKLTTNFFGYSFFVIVITFFSCKKFVQVDSPKTIAVQSSVFSDDPTAISAIMGVYSSMIASNGFASGGLYSITSLTGLSSDELINYLSANDQNQFYTNSLLSSNNTLQSNLWNEPYTYIYTVNSILEELNRSSKVSDSTRRQLQGEAKFLRAFSYFYLVNLFGDVPLVLTSDYRINSTLPRSSKAIVYDQIIADLKDAQSLLNSNYVSGTGSITTERVRPNKSTATALLARTYLFLGDWNNAEIQATNVINTSAYSLVSNLNNVFLKNSAEAIWQLMPVISGRNTNEGFYFISTGTPSYFSINSSLISDFEPNDNRKINWTKTITVGSNTFVLPYKYKVQANTTLTEYSSVFRFAEMFLIRAEARAQQNNISGAQSDLNLIRTRAGLAGTLANDKPSLLTAIDHERRIEFFAEWGHRWLDLKRRGTINAVLSSIKGGNWQSTDSLYPIPLYEITSNPNLSQNPGY